GGEGGGGGGGGGEGLKAKKLRTIIDNKDSYGVKSSLGRNSQEGYIGKSYEDNVWTEKINKILKK
uniref:hypothetical protein n=1 Tax=Clostridium sp. ZBS12 TaxID=2949972 RepID=UPI00207A3DF7